MNLFRKFTLIALVAFSAAMASAQNIQAGKDFLYRERYQSAKNVFQQLASANPADETAAYYLGQSLIGLEDIAGAKTLYRRALTANSNSPLIIAGLGHIALLEGNTADARNQFQAAASLAAGKRIDVLNAIGAPNSDPDVKNGDANYAVQVLTQATQIKGFKDPEVWANLGDAYRKIGDGGNAIKSYESALAINPKYARAIYRKGRLYQSQGIAQENLYTGFYNQAIATDASYAPVYYTLFNYYYNTDVPRSAQYLEQWLQNSDADPKACYYRASLKFAQGLFNEAITQADACVTAEGTNVYPNVYGVKAISYNRLGEKALATGDSAEAKRNYENARVNYEKYFSLQKADKIGSGDYSTYGLLLLKTPGNEAQAAQYIQRAVALDSLEANRVNFLKALGAAYREKKDFASSASAYNQILSLKKSPTNLDLYNAGYDFFRAAKFDSAVSVFGIYTQKYPDDMFGYYMIAKATSGIDTLRAGPVVPAYLKAIEVGEKAADPMKVKAQLAEAYNFMSQYNLEVKKDNATATMFVDKALAIDPANTTSVALKDYISRGGRPAAPQKPGTPATKPGSPPPPPTPRPPQKKK